VRTTRRRFLRLAGSGLAGLAALPALPAGAAATEQAGAAAGFFSARERAVLRAVVARMVETGDPRAPALDDTDAVATIERACAGLAPDLTDPLPWALRLVEWWPFLFELRLQPFTSLSDAEQDASLEGWMRSRFGLRRLAFLALRNLAMLGWWSQEATWPLIGYRGPLLEGARGAPPGGAGAA